MSEVRGGSSAILRRALAKIDPTVTMTMVDSLDLRAHAKVSAVVGVPLRQLQQRRDVASFASSAPIAAVRALIELMALGPLEKVVELLGDHGDNPTFEELSSAIDEALATGTSVDEMVAVLAYAVAESFAAAPHCQRLLEERPEFTLPELEVAAAPTILAPARQVDPGLREQRRARREAEKRRRRPGVPVRPARPAKAKAVPARSTAAPPRPAVDEVVEVERRRLILTPLEVTRFDDHHPLVGAVLVAEVPFDAKDPSTPEATSKERPVLVVAASDEELLVRPIYSATSATRSLFSPWRRIGLDHVSYVDDSRVALARPTGHSLVLLGRLTSEEWNALI